ncbi:hypothetical protein GCM10025875_13710 [Litorihabitans aurantiacus]|uniref:Preprotein translocase subunit YajC n=1 Tax=Litorihabitans aurantiacus TaxID=1930061 RepID=A0AA37XDW7_9MICO|nr:hypothetical protein GCM10025875_13710 [Litorihabitans aurantiacus]
MLLIGLLVLAVGGMFLLSRRNRKQQGSVNDFRATLAPGAEVMTASGQLGVVVDRTGDAVTIESSGTRTTWVIAAIQQVPPQFSAAADAAFGRAVPDETPAPEGDPVDADVVAPDDASSLTSDGPVTDDRTERDRPGPDVDGGPTSPDQRP